VGFIVTIKIKLKINKILHSTLCFQQGQWVLWEWVLDLDSTMVEIKFYFFKNIFFCGEIIENHFQNPLTH
jgi:hypothetical protein